MIAGLTLSFSPFIPWAVIAVFAALALLIAIMNIAARLRGAWFRALALALFVAALTNPSLSNEDRETLPNVVAVVVDTSASQVLGERTAQTAAIREALDARLKGLSATEVRMVEAGASPGDTDGTALFGALSNALADVPPERVGGAIFITDGLVHDIPAKAEALGFFAPVHALVTGKPGERDRRIALVEAPRFGIVGRSQTVRLRVIDSGLGMPATATIVVRRDGEEIARQSVPVNEPAALDIPITHGGPNIVEMTVDPVEGELTALNNKAVLPIEGIRDKLRVLLVSGEPHAGERTWRNLLKADANVELVHFTILRPPQKQDGTPINELSLIAFPVRQLFDEKIDEFDLIILDRYAQQGILPFAYFENIAAYVRKGGAVLVASGPDYASEESVWYTPLADILPAEPTGSILEEPYRVGIAESGKRHPVTRGLPGAGTEPPGWSEWFRLVEARQRSGTTVMQGPDTKPLLILDKQGEGRVALMLSDHAWLWARGYGGGGPHVDLLRRLSHWLMKEPDLEEEALRAVARNGDLVVERQTMADTIEPIVVTDPTGATSTATMTQAAPGLWRGALKTGQVGLWRVSDGKLTTLVNVGPANPREFQDVISTTERLSQLVQATGGAAVRADPQAGIAIPRLALVSDGGPYAGEGWMGLRKASVTVVKGIGVVQLFAGLLGLALLLGALSAMWAREGR